jgi:hypothetical protein
LDAYWQAVACVLLLRPNNSVRPLAAHWKQRCRQHCVRLGTQWPKLCFGEMSDRIIGPFNSSLTAKPLFVIGYEHSFTEMDAANE